MTKKQKKLLQELKNVAEGPVAWDFAHVDVDAVKFVLSEIKRLKEKCNSLLTSISNATPEHYPAKENLKLEVIE